MTKRTCLAVTLLFLLFLGLFLTLHVFLPDRDFSERENRYLESFPRFSLSALFSGAYTKDLETYTSEQFPLRDAWITLKAAAERASGKAENNGVFLCGDEMLIEPYQTPDPEVLQRNIQAVTALADNSPAQVFLALIPDKAQVFADRLPKNAPNENESAVIEAVCRQVGAETIPMESALTEHREDGIFYRTDHHWTTLGAWYGYAALCDALELEATPLAAFSPETVSDRFYGTQYSSSGFSWIRPDSIKRFAMDPGNLTVTNYRDGTPEPGSLYEDDYLEKKDKYAMFLGGNTPLLQIRTSNTEGKRLLLLRDSYADCMVPFLLPHFSEIHLIDLRYYKSGVADYISENGIDQVVVLYSVRNFSSDANIPLMAR